MPRLFRSIPLAVLALSVACSSTPEGGTASTSGGSTSAVDSTSGGGSSASTAASTSASAGSGTASGVATSSSASSTGATSATTGTAGSSGSSTGAETTTTGGTSSIGATTASGTSGSGGGTTTGTTGATLPADPTWNNFAGQFIQTYCIECHGASKPHNFTVEANVISNAATIRCGVATAQDPAWHCTVPLEQFPQKHVATLYPTDAERTEMVLWINNGTP